METTTCSHKESISSMVGGIETGKCNICHQVRRYDRREPKAVVEILKLGRIDSKLVLPGPKEKLYLSAEENDELMLARKDGHKASNPGPVAPPAVEDIGGRDWYRAHKKEMIEDLLTMGQEAFRKKWPIKRQIFSHLKSDPLYKGRISPAEGVKDVKKRGPKPKKDRPQGTKRGSPAIEDVVAALKKGEADKLPPFPEWAPEKWVSSEIAVQWLRTFEAIQGMQLVLLLSNTRAAPPAPMVKAKRGNWFSRLFKQ